MISLNDVINNPWNIEKFFWKIHNGGSFEIGKCLIRKMKQQSINLAMVHHFFFVWFRDFQTKLTAYWCSALIYTSIFWSHSMEMPFKIIHNFSINNICIKFNGSKENKILLIYRIVFHWRDSFLSLFSEAMAIPNILSYFKIEFFFTSFIKNINHTAYNINL